ncbi:cytidine deaminase [Lacrimispora saccharolytica]|uniref:Cytidine deaminase n=1 Tax=Lacrimispora saccharolytica (strain ATCC 35040 / DSM 2544 / NRCC 2533 / WM1) TaxID=610130 RepID=D9RAK1_LACSW|nr:cytidine deaminase [Lacrimispora saccharolytica]ADL04279.1 cytidine deaminase [[Clostridium] saccharolyticum WM1]QRV21445.1 cytidine deaminase [Lacrimispora saccharolytica]
MKEKSEEHVKTGEEEAGAELPVKEMIRQAYEAMARAYTPYSGFKVGAALLAADGTFYQGCNIENAAYTPSNCAERTAFFKAVSQGVREFKAICIVGGKEGIPMGITPPCGVCRQVMMEFCDPETFRIILAAGKEEYKMFSLKELLPLGFGPEDLG